MSRLSELERLQTTYHELKKQERLVRENIEALNASYYNTTVPIEKLQFKRDLEQTEQELEKIEDRIGFIESQMERNPAQMILEQLMHLDYVEHLERFEEFLDREQSGVFIVHGYAGCGLRLLVKRIERYVFLRPWSRVSSLKINVRAIQKVGYCASRFADEFKPRNLWRELGKKLNCSALPQEVAARIEQQCQTQTVLLVFDEIDLTCKAQRIILEIWQELLTQMNLKGVQPKNPLLFLLVVTEQDGWEMAEMALQERYTPSWRPDIPVKLPPVEHYALHDVETWLQFFCQNNPVYRKQRSPDLLCKIFGESQYASPEQVISGIFTHLCHYEFQEGVFKEWLNL